MKYTYVYICMYIYICLHVYICKYWPLCVNTILLGHALARNVTPDPSELLQKSQEPTFGRQQVRTTDKKWKHVRTSYIFAVWPALLGHYIHDIRMTHWFREIWMTYHRLTSYSHSRYYHQVRYFTMKIKLIKLVCLFSWFVCLRSSVSIRSADTNLWVSRIERKQIGRASCRDRV